jgi:hypothetical protein
MGDQNAGKSTFLHTFTHNEDERFLELSSLLPVYVLYYLLSLSPLSLSLLSLSHPLSYLASV